MSKPRGVHEAPAVAKLRPTALPRLVVESLLVILLAGCLAPLRTAIMQGGPSSTPAGILDGSLQSTTLAEVKEAIDKLYRDHPGINSFMVRSVTYTPETRDKVLKICSEGGLVATEQERETQKVLACAPLIFFFYSYGQQSSVPESVDLARRLYWYAMADKSEDSRKILTNLLRAWGIE